MSVLYVEGGLIGCRGWQPTLCDPDTDRVVVRCGSIVESRAEALRYAEEYRCNLARIISNPSSERDPRLGLLVPGAETYDEKVSAQMIENYVDAHTILGLNTSRAA